MASISIRKDSRVKDNGESVILLSLRFDKNKIDFNTGVSCKDFDKNTLLPNSERNYKVKNTRLKYLQACLEKFVLDNNPAQYSKEEYKSLVLSNIFGQGEQIESEYTFLYYFEKFTSLKINKSTRILYENTKNKIFKFDPGCTFESITKDWLIRFDNHMKLEGNSINSRSVNMRNIRAVFNYCIDEEYTTLYPFRRFQIKQEETRKRSITVEQLRELRDYPVESFQERYRDTFMLIFYLIGINIGDLCLLRQSDLINGRIEYKRLKTGKRYSIKVEPEAMNIINKYKGKRYLLNFMDEYSNYADYKARVNRGLQKIGPFRRVGMGGKKIIEPIMPFLTTYWARHTWATIAAYLDIPKEIIAAGLGHSQDSVTDIYIKLDPRKVDKANRKIIDFVNSIITTDEN